MKNLIFVYGTLRKGFGNHRLLENAEFLGIGRTKEKYKMTANGIPFVSKNEPVSYIIGEVYKIDDKTLKRLDELEGHPDWYKREKVKIILETGKEVEAWIYFNEVSEGKYLVKSGDFDKFRIIR
ncbi:gamma-glutamylcyclotransferase family protein [Persephonella sp.]